MLGWLGYRPAKPSNLWVSATAPQGSIGVVMGSQSHYAVMQCAVKT